MTFTVTYRGVDGAMREERIEAAGRAECLAQMKARGIAPMGVKEGNPVSRRGAEARRGKMGGKGLFSCNFTFYILHFTFAIAVVAAMAVVWWWLDRDNARPSPEPEVPKKTAQPKEATPLKAPKHVPEPEAPKNIVVSPRAAKDPQQAEDTNKWQIVNGFKVPKGARLIKNSLTNRQERIFKDSTDTLIASYLQQPVHGILPPPVPMTANAGERFLRSLENPIEIKDTDSEEIRAQKEAVIVARAQIKELMDGGATFEEILSEHRKLAEENLKIRRNAQKELNEIFNSGDFDGATRYKKVIDVALEQMGVEPLDKPLTKDERREQKRLRREAALDGAEP